MILLPSKWRKNRMERSKDTEDYVILRNNKVMITVALNYYSQARWKYRNWEVVRIVLARGRNNELAR